MGVQTRNRSVAGKAAQRKDAMADLGTGLGMIYCACIGEGEVAAASGYPAKKIVGNDLDRDAVEVARGKFPEARIAVRDAKTYRQFGREKFGLGDIDPFGTPWGMVNQFLAFAPLKDTVHLCLHDGTREAMMRKKRPYNFAAQRMEDRAGRSAKAQLKNYDTDLTEWIEDRFGITVNFIRTVAVKGEYAGIYYLHIKLTNCHRRLTESGISGGGVTDEFDLIASPIEDLPLGGDGDGAPLG